MHPQQVRHTEDVAATRTQLDSGEIHTVVSAASKDCTNTLTPSYLLKRAALSLLPLSLYAAASCVS